MKMGHIPQKEKKDTVLASKKSTNDLDRDARDKKVLSAFRDQMKISSPALNRQERKLMLKVKNGNDLSKSDDKLLQKASHRHFDENSRLLSRYIKLYDGKIDSVSYKDLPTDKKAKADYMMQQMIDHRKAMRELSYTRAILLEQKYAKEIGSEKNEKLIDPAYRNFESVEEKAKAEADYLKLWTTDPDTLKDANTENYGREWLHMQTKINMLSMDGNEGNPASERNIAMFDYKIEHADDSLFDFYDSYENWIPKYEKTEKWKNLQEQKRKISNELGLDEKWEKYRSHPSKTESEFEESEKLYSLYMKALKKYSEKTKNIKSQEEKIKNAFNEQICKNTLLDIGYEVTPENIEAIKYVIWWH